MTTTQKWLDLAHKASQQADELDRILSDLKLQCRKLSNNIDSLNELERLCKLEADKEEIDLEDAEFDARTDEESENVRRGD